MQTRSLLRRLVSLGLLYIAPLAVPQASAVSPAPVAIIVPGQGEGPDTYSTLATVLEDYLKVMDGNQYVRNYVGVGTP